MNTTTNINVSELNDEQLKALEKQIRERKTQAKRSEKFAKYEPTYSDYRKAVVGAKTANDLKKSLLADLKKLGFGVKTPKPTTTTKTAKKK